jgi:hypothetical protein
LTSTVPSATQGKGGQEITFSVPAGSGGIHSGVRISCRGQIPGLDGEPGQDAIQPARQGPVGRADEVHEGGHQQAADEQGVD